MSPRFCLFSCVTTSDFPVELVLLSILANFYFNILYRWQFDLFFCDLWSSFCPQLWKRWLPSSRAPLLRPSEPGRTSWSSAARSWRAAWTPCPGSSTSSTLHRVGKVRIASFIERLFIEKKTGNRVPVHIIGKKVPWITRDIDRHTYWSSTSLWIKRTFKAQRIQLNICQHLNTNERTPQQR